MARPRTLIRYALADLWHNRVASLATMLLFTVVAGPPFLIYTAERTMISAWTEEIARDVSNREVIVVRGREDDRWLTPGEIAEIAGWPETGFLAPEASFSVRSHEWARLAPGAFRPSQAAFVTLDLGTTGPGDPLFEGYAAPAGLYEAGVTAEAARLLGLGPGDSAMLKVERTRQGRTEREYLDMKVVAILPEAVHPGPRVFVLPRLAHAIRQFQYNEIARDAFPEEAATEATRWPTLRIYAPSVHEAPALRDRLRAFGFPETRLQSDQIERIRRTEAGIGAAFALVLGLAVAGFLATLVLLHWTDAERRRAELALLMTLGHSSAEVATMRMIEAAVTIGAGLMLALGAVALSTGSLEALAREALGLSGIGTPPWGMLFLASVVAIVTGMLGAFVVTRHSRNRDTAEALRLA